MANFVPLKRLFLYLLQYISILFWGLPVFVQKPFKVLLLIFIAYIFFACCSVGRIKKSYLLIALIGVFITGISAYYGDFQSSVVNVAISFLVIPTLHVFDTYLTIEDKKKLKKTCYFLCISMFVQLCVFRSEDGRPSLSYELNNSGAYLFLFFLYSDFLKFKVGKFFVICASLLILSRLLILAIFLFYVTRFFKKVVWRIHKVNYYISLLIVSSLFFLFNLFFIINVERGDSYDTSAARISQLNDGSNFLRFTINMNVLSNLFYDEKFKFGYGNIVGGNNPEYSSKYTLMPHNEMLDSIAEFGYYFTIYAFFFSGLYFRKVFLYENFEYLIPLIIYSLILWVRFLIVPSVEMFFILLILNSRINYVKQYSYIGK